MKQTMWKMASYNRLVTMMVINRLHELSVDCLLD